MDSDSDLLDRYTAAGDSAAFGKLVQRYLPLVYAAARRRTADPAAADDVCQAVFLVLAKKAKTLHARRPLGDWLLTVTKYASANLNKQRRRRQRHEAAAAKPEGAMIPAHDDGEPADWTRHLDDALDRLPATDRRAVLLRFYNAHAFSEVAATLGVSEVAARRRVARAVERLRTTFAGRGLAMPTAAIISALPAVLAVAPPAALAASVATVGTTASVSASTLLISKGTLHTMFITKCKTAAAVALAMIVTAGGGVGLVVRAGPPATTTGGALFPPATPVVGWLKVEVRGPASGSGRVETTFVEPSSGRRVSMQPERDTVSGFDDPPAGVSGRYHELIKQFVVGPAELDAGDVPPVIESALLEMLRNAKATRVEIRSTTPGGERLTRITTDLDQLPPDGRKDVPPVLEMHADADTGLVRRVTVPATAGTAAKDILTITPVPGPPADDLNRPETLPLPDGTTLLDNRPSAEAREVLRRLDEVVDQGVGLNAVAIVKRSASPTSGEFSPDLDEVTIEAGSAKRFVIATWQIGKGTRSVRDDEPQRARQPAGWPKPTFRQVLDAVGSTRPNRFAVYDGTNAWVADSGNSDGKLAEDGSGRRPLTNPAGYWRSVSFVGQLWGVFASDTPGVFTKFTLGLAPGDSADSDRRVLTAQTSNPLIQPDGTMQVQAMYKVKMLLIPDLGPMPVRIESEDMFSIARGQSKTIIDVGLAAWMFRKPVRVPEHWRRLSIDESSPSYPQYHAIVAPRDGESVPAVWFADPAVTWPRAK